MRGPFGLDAAFVTIAGKRTASRNCRIRRRASVLPKLMSRAASRVVRVARSRYGEVIAAPQAKKNVLHFNHNAFIMICRYSLFKMPLRRRSIPFTKSRFRLLLEMLTCARGSVPRWSDLQPPGKGSAVRSGSCPVDLPARIAAGFRLRPAALRICDVGGLGPGPTMPAVSGRPVETEHL